jgi:hypothetical protein
MPYQFLPTKSTAPIAFAKYGNACDRSYTQKRKTGTNTPIPTNFVTGECEGGDSCANEFAHLVAGGAFDGENHHEFSSCGSTGIFGTNAHTESQCIQVKWPELNKAECCLGTLDDRTNCSPDWCPMSKGCGNSEATIAHCARLLPNGKAALMDESTGCGQWCKDFPKSCDQAKIRFCRKHKGRKECRCMIPGDQPDFKALEEFRKDSGLPPNNTASYCWWIGCHEAGEDLVNVFKTSDITNGEKLCPAQELTICNQIINLQKGASKNVFDNVKFQTACGAELPPPGKQSDPRDDPKHKPNQIVDPVRKPVNDTTKVLLAGGAALALIMIIVLIANK